MASLPVKPTTIPQARRFTRRFNPNQTRQFVEGDSIVFDIPPMKHTYLTKNARVHFTMNYSFTDNSPSSVENLANFIYTTEGLDANAKSIVSGWFASNIDGVLPWKPAVDPVPYLDMYQPQAINSLRKPVPCLDTCGPYGFFRSCEVYDYLGGTLLEKIDRHDLMAAMLWDYHLDDEVKRLIPDITEQFQNLNDYDNLLSSTGDILSNLNAGEPPHVTRPNCKQLIEPDLSWYDLPTSTAAKKTRSTNPLTFTNYTNSFPTHNLTYNALFQQYECGPLDEYTPEPWRFSIDLLGFLGRSSDKFVPLHNGFRIVFKLNDPNVPIKFSLPSGGCVLSYLLPENNNTYEQEIEPTITSFSISDVKLVTDLLEIGPELDSQVDKIVHAKMINYVPLGKCDAPTIIPGNYLSMTNVKVAFRSNPFDKYHSVLGYRMYPYITKASILYNDAELKTYETVNEMLIGCGPGFHPTISVDAYLSEFPSADLVGTGGYMYPFPSQTCRLLWFSNSQALYKHGFFWFNSDADSISQNLNPLFTRSNDQSGKFLLNFDLQLNGYQSNQITGIDSTKKTVKLKLTKSYNLIEPYNTDVFIEFDAIVKVDPEKSTSVSF
jgi:hypothetical protein